MHLFIRLKYKKGIATLFVKFKTYLSGNASIRVDGWRENGATSSLGLFIKCIELSEGLDIFKSTRELCLNILVVVRITRIAICYISKVWMLFFILALGDARRVRRRASASIMLLAQWWLELLLSLARDRTNIRIKINIHYFYLQSDIIKLFSHSVNTKNRIFALNKVYTVLTRES